MWGLFRRKRLLSEEDEYFQLESYRWLLTHFGGDQFYKRARLILPTREFFPAKADSPSAAAELTFEQVKEHAGMAQWPCRLQAQETDPEAVVAPTVVMRNVKQGPLGTFSVKDESEVLITYNPKIVGNPIQMVATFAHELAHYLTGTAPEPPPGGWENWEFATDICATFLGFGIFQANAAFQFTQYMGIDSQGWRSSRSGYLSEAEHSYALAIFLGLKQLPVRRALPYCSPNIKTFLRMALRELENNAFLEQLRAADYVPRSR